MENCLVTKLKDSVNNSSLQYLGCIEFNVKTASSSATADNSKLKLVVAANESITIEAKDGGYFATSFANLDTEETRLTTLTVNAGDSDTSQTIYAANMNFKIIVNAKYGKIKEIEANSLAKGRINTNISLFGFNDVLTDLKDYSAVGDISAIKGANITNLWFSRTSTNSNIYGDISHIGENCPKLYWFRVKWASNIFGDIAGFSPCTHLTQLVCSSSKIFGDIASLGTCTSLTRLEIQSTAVTGTVEDFVSGQVDNGRTTTNSSSFTWTSAILKQISFGGHYYNNEECNLYWDGKNKIWFVGATTVYQKGCTAEEIAAWEQAGKTVINVDA